MRSINLLLVLLIPVLLCMSCQSKKDPDTTLIKIACIGNSITYGMGIKDRETKAYPPQLEKILGNNYEVKNFGINGRTILKKGDYPYWEEDLFDEALKAMPNIVIIKLGTNDVKSHNWKFKDEFITDYKEMIDLFSKLPTRPVIYICYPVPLFTNRPEFSNTTIVNEIIPMLDTIAIDKNVTAIDLYTPLKGKEKLFPDKVHPNAKGARIIAKTIATILQNKKQ